MLASFGDALSTAASGRPRRFATVSEDGLLSVWDSEAAGELQQQHARPTHLAVRWTCMAWWQPDAAAGHLALGSDSGVVVIWDLAVGQISHELRGHTQRVNDVAFERGGKTLLSCSRDKQVCCWSAATGELLHTFAAGQAAVQRLAPTFSASHVLLGGTAIRLVRASSFFCAATSAPFFWRRRQLAEPRSARAPSPRCAGAA